MTKVKSLRLHLKRSILKQSIIGVIAIVVVLTVVTYFLGRYKAARDLEETAKAAAKSFHSRILEGEIKLVERQLRDLLKLEANEEIQILDKQKLRIYQGDRLPHLIPKCNFIGFACVTGYGQNAEILEPIAFDPEGRNLFGYLYLSRKIQIDWIFLSIVSIVFSLGYLAVFFGVTKITKTTMKLLVDGLESWSQQLSQNPKDISSFSETSYFELMPLQIAIEGLNTRIEEYENSAAEKAKLLLLRGIAHDLVGPVAQVQLYLATLKKKAEAHPEFNRLIRDTESSVEKVSAIASQVKMLRSLPDPKDQVEVVTCLKREIESLRQDGEVINKKIRLAFENKGFSNAYISLSEPELSRLMQNLVHNSAHASFENSIIEVRVTSDSFGVTISVRDQGHGIPEEIQTNIFQPDFTSKIGTGTGLGLSVVKHIVETRGGRIRLESSQAGTAIEITFPIQNQIDLKEGVSNG